MISFIVIGRNEEKNVRQCIESINTAAAYASVTRYEIIYVDARSTDRSVEIVKAFPEIKIFKVTGKYNAAVCRNIGAKEASGSVYFFLEANMEISGKFLASTYNSAMEYIKEHFISGDIIEITDNKSVRINSNKRAAGKIFFIASYIWKNVGGMNTKFYEGEDYDFCLKVIKQNYRFKRKREIIARRYIISNRDASEVWKGLKNRRPFFSRCVLLRDHFFNREVYAILLRRDKSFIAMIAAIISSFFSLKTGGIFFLLFLAIVFIRSMQTRKQHSVIVMMIYFLVVDVLNLICFFTFFPKKIKEEYMAVE